MLERLASSSKLSVVSAMRDSARDTELSSPAGRIDETDYLARCKFPNENNEEPSGDALNEWIAGKTVEFFNELYLQYSAAADGNEFWQALCAPTPKKEDETVISFKGFPNGVRFVWKENRKSPIEEISADEYCKRTFLWGEKIIGDPNIFSQDQDHPFPPTFRTIVSKIFVRLFRIYAIIISNNCLRQTVNNQILYGSFKQFIYFGWFWDLIEDKDVKGIITPIVEEMRKNYETDLKFTEF